MADEYNQYNIIEHWLHAILKDRLRLPGQNKHNGMIAQIFQCLTNCFMKDALFRLLFQRFYMAGSFGDRLNTKDPDNYDVNVVFDIPANMELNIENRFTRFGYVQLNIKNSLYIPNIMKQLTFEDEFNETYISVEATKYWFQKLVVNALNEKKYKIFNRIKISSTTGPAITLKFASNKLLFDLNLSVCFTFNKPITFGTFNFISDEYFIVPNPSIKNIGWEPWKISYSEQEREMIFNDKMSFLHCAIKLVKLFFDDEKEIKSYVKAMALRMVDEENDFFHKKSYSYSFMQLLIRFRMYLQPNCEMVPLWDARIHLIWNPIYLATFNNRINKFINLVNSVDKTNKAKYEKQFMSYFKM